MRKFILSSFFAILLFSCGTKKENIVYDVPIEIILDHPIADINIKNNKELFELLLPFPEGVSDDSIILNFVPYFKRIDFSPVYVDSLKIDSSLLIKANVWLGGGRKNPSLFIKNRVQEIEDAILSNSFKESNGKQSVVDSFLFNNPNRYLILSQDTALLSSYKVGFKNSTVIAFTSYLDIKKFIRSKIDSLSKLDRPTHIIFFPAYKYIPRIDTLETYSKKDTNPSVLVRLHEEKIILKHEKLQKQDHKDLNSQVPCEESIIVQLEKCLNMPNGEPKLIFFYDKVFRFVKYNPCNSDVYKQLLTQVQPLIYSSTPRYVKGGYNAFYNLTCSHLSDLVQEFERLSISYNSLAINDILKQCPNKNVN